MSVNQNPANPQFRAGTETTNSSGVVSFETGLQNVEHLSCSFTNSAGKDESKFDWSVDANGLATVTVLKAACGAGDTAVSFTWLAYGF